MIEINHVTFAYANAESGALRDFSLQVGAGEVVLLCGGSGCGKTTVTRLINGLIPRYYEGDLTGSVRVGGLDVAAAELYETSRIVGSVFQNPRSQFFCVDTTSEIAFACENQGLVESVIRERIAEAAHELHAEPLLGRSIFNLSGGEKQKIACASVSAAHPEVYVLDEPTSNLDAAAIENLKATLKLWKAGGKTIVIAEHRLHWLREVVDRVVYLADGEIGFDMSMKAFIELSPERLRGLGLRPLTLAGLANETPATIGTDTLELRDFNYSYDGKKLALAIDRLSLPRGGITAVIGGNGAGKSTFSKCLCGLAKGFRGTALLDGESIRRRGLIKKSYMVMQDVNHQLFCETVSDEVRLGMRDDNEATAAEILDAFGLTPFSERHPVSLSGGQKQRVAIASALLADKEILILDEPTSGLDHESMRKTSALIRSLCNLRCVLIVTHDPELILSCCTHVLHLEAGHVGEFYPLDTEGGERLLAFFIKKEEYGVEETV